MILSRAPGQNVSRRRRARSQVERLNESSRGTALVMRGSASQARRLDVWGGIIGPTALVGAWAALGTRLDGYSPVHDPISRLAANGASTQTAMTIGFLAYAGGVLPFARALKRELPDSAAAVAAAVSALGGLAIAATPLDSPLGGTPHALAAGITYVSLATTPLLAARAAEVDGRESPRHDRIAGCRSGQRDWPHHQRRRRGTDGSLAAHWAHRRSPLARCGGGENAALLGGLIPPLVATSPRAPGSQHHVPAVEDPYGARRGDRRTCSRARTRGRRAKQITPPSGRSWSPTWTGFGRASVRQRQNTPGHLRRLGRSTALRPRGRTPSPSRLDRTLMCSGLVGVGGPTSPNARWRLARPGPPTTSGR